MLNIIIKKIARDFSNFIEMAYMCMLKYYNKPVKNFKTNRTRTENIECQSLKWLFISWGSLFKLQKIEHSFVDVNLILFTEGIPRYFS